MTYFISAEYTYLPGNNCGPDFIESFSTLEAAKAACANNKECKCIDDIGCNGGTWDTYTGHEFFSGQGDCAWMKCNITSVHYTGKTYVDQSSSV